MAQLLRLHDLAPVVHRRRQQRVSRRVEHLGRDVQQDFHVLHILLVRAHAFIDLLNAVLHRGLALADLEVVHAEQRRHLRQEPHRRRFYIPMQQMFIDFINEQFQGRLGQLVGLDHVRVRS